MPEKMQVDIKGLSLYKLKQKRIKGH